MEKQFYPLAVNILNLQRYNFEYLSLEEVVLFDYFVVKGRSFKFKEFYHSTRVISDETGLKRHTIEKAIKKFQQLKILSISVYSMPKVKHFEVDYKLIAEQLPMIYNLTSQSVDFEKSLVEFYKQLVENSEQKKDKDYSKKEKNEIEKERSSLQKSFQDFLTSLKSNSMLHASNFKFNEELFIKAVDQYGFEQLTAYIKDYFKKNYLSASLSKFFGNYSNSGEIEFIEKSEFEKEKEVKQFIKELESSYNERRVQLSTNQQRYPITKLPIRKIDSQSIKDLLKEKSQEVIRNSFIAYCDSVIKKELKVKYFLVYFLTKKEGEYVVINNYLEIFNSKYVVKK